MLFLKIVFPSNKNVYVVCRSCAGCVIPYVIEGTYGEGLFFTFQCPNFDATPFDISFPSFGLILSIMKFYFSFVSTS